ncbi:putative reverse transcriptase domain-containing protein [Tanacetum coccineum]
MAPRGRPTRLNPCTIPPPVTDPTTTTLVTSTQLQAMIDEGVTAVLAARATTRNGDYSHTSRTGGHRRSGMETVFRISNCTVENQVKFATCTLMGTALTWWNSHARTVTNEEAIEMATELMDRRINTLAERQTEKQRKFEDAPRNNQNQQPNKRRTQAGPIAAGEPVTRKTVHEGTKPRCPSATSGTNCPQLEKNKNQGNVSGVRLMQRELRAKPQTTYVVTGGLEEPGEEEATSRLSITSKNFPKYFPEDLPGLSPTDKWNSYRSITWCCTYISKTCLQNSILEHYEFQVMPFCLDQKHPAVFMDLMQPECGKTLLDKFIIVFIDDILIYSKNKQEHGEHLKIILELLKKEELYAKFSKCEFWIPKVQFLGHVIDNKGIHVDPAKIKSVKDWLSKDAKEIRQFFFGLAGGVTKQKQRFQLLKQKLCSAHSGSYRRKVRFYVYCDASNKGLGSCIDAKGKRRKLDMRSTRWLELLVITIAILLSPRKANVVADALSRKKGTTQLELEKLDRLVRMETPMASMAGAWLTCYGALADGDPAESPPNRSINSSSSEENVPRQGQGDHQRQSGLWLQPKYLKWKWDIITMDLSQNFLSHHKGL